MIIILYCLLRCKRPRAGGRGWGSMGSGRRTYCGLIGYKPFFRKTSTSDLPIEYGQPPRNYRLKVSYFNIARRGSSPTPLPLLPPAVALIQLLKLDVKMGALKCKARLLIHSDT